MKSERGRHETSTLCFHVNVNKHVQVAPVPHTNTYAFALYTHVNIDYNMC